MIAKMLQISKYKKIILISVFILAVFLICFHFTDTPSVWVDEGVFTEVAKNLALHGVLGLQTAPGEFFPMNNFLLSTSYPVIVPVAGSFAFFGTGVWQARLPMVIYMLTLVVLFYLFTKRKYGFLPAILSVFFLLSFSPFYGNGRPVQGEVAGLVFLVLGVWLLLFWEEGGFKNPKWALFGGLALGLSASTKPIFLLGVSLALVFSLFFWLKKIKNKRTLSILSLSFIAPVFIWCFIHFSTLEELSKFVTNILYFSSNHGTETPLSQTILTNFLKFFTESTPILFLLMFLVIIFSVVYKFYKKEDSNISISEFFILSFVILNWLGFLVGTGWYRYFFPAHVLLYLLFPASIIVLSQIFNKEILKKSLFIIPVFLIIFQFYHLVFLSDTSFIAKRTANSELSAALSKIKSNEKVLFYNVPEVIIFLRGDNYSQYLNMIFLEAGKKDALADSSFSVILTGADPEKIGFSLHCYDKNSVNEYFLFQRKSNCKK
jgi:4-amino-4-deoxy-L-arabinose transferase-like glycosyltransferase